MLVTAADCDVRAAMELAESGMAIPDDLARRPTAPRGNNMPQSQR